MMISTLIKGSAGALTAVAICVAQAGPASATMLKLTDSGTEKGILETVTFKATASESFVIDQGYQKPDIEKLTNNMVTLVGGGPNLLGPTWQSRFAAFGSNSYTFNDATAVPALGFTGQNKMLDTFSQTFATVPGDTYTYSFNYWNNTAGFGSKPSKLIVTASSVPEASTWAMMLLGFAGLGLLGYRHRAKVGRRAPLC
jgi:hypothetical protein